MDEDDAPPCCFWLLVCCGFGGIFRRPHRRPRPDTFGSYNVAGSPQERGTYRPFTREAVDIPAAPSFSASSSEPVKSTLVGSFNYQVDLPMPSWEEKRRKC